MTSSAANLDPFELRFAEAIDSGELLAAGTKVVVGVSGGADSVALLTGLHALAGQPSRRYELTVAHLDHGLRDESAADAEFVTGMADRWGLRCVIERVETTAEAERLGEGIEHAARSLRYDFFARVAKKCSADAVATAHHADDNVETILFRLLRGTALRGLGGMAAARPLNDLRGQAGDSSSADLPAGEAGESEPAGGAAPAAVSLIRPMLGFRQSEILEYCRRRDMPWREDHTNEDTTYRRNFIRHELLPLIRKHINPQADEALLRLGSLAAETEAFLVAEARRLLEQSVSLGRADKTMLDITMFAPAKPVVRRTALRLVLEQLGAPQRDLSAEHLQAIDALLTEPAATVNLPGGFRAHRKRNQLIIGCQH
ncbi:MAG: tRNA lysidine(34) synthetase TilS [Phycisphaerae bacterium]|nr:tRNA lysidine(34) synthetase TilS [Phycisphaerae bacterium]